MFKIGDWVQITPTPDTRWNVWRNNKEVYDEFAGKIGTIEGEDEDDERQGESLFKVRVHFEYGIASMGPGSYYEWFRPEHLIRSSKYDADIQKHRAETARQLQEWEAFKKKSTDDALRKVFGKEEPKEEPKRQHARSMEDEEDDVPSWNYMDTDYSNYFMDYDQKPNYNFTPVIDYEYPSNTLDDGSVFVFSTSSDEDKNDK